MACAGLRMQRIITIIMEKKVTISGLGFKIEGAVNKSWKEKDAVLDIVSGEVQSGAKTTKVKPYKTRKPSRKIFS